MNTQEIAARFRLSGWVEMVKERIASGQSVAEFCKENNICISTYYRRQRKVREAVCIAHVDAQRQGSPFVPSALTERPASYSPVPSGWTQLREMEADISVEKPITIEINGCRIQAEAATDPELLAKVCRVLKSLC